MRFPSPVLSVISLLCLCLVPAAAAFAQASPERPYAHYSCHAHAFKDYAASLFSPFESMAESGHEAHFEILSAPGAPALLVWAGYSFVDAEGRRGEVSRSFTAFGLFVLNHPTAGRPARGGFLPGDPHLLLTGRYVSFLAVPPNRLITPSEKFEVLALPREWATGNLPLYFNVLAKIVQGEAGSYRASWSKLYEADCRTTLISEKEFLEHEKHWAQRPDLEPAPRLHREAALGALWPALHARWASTGPEQRKFIYRAALATAATGSALYLAQASRAILGFGEARALALLGPLGAWLALTIEANAQESLTGRLSFTEVDKFLSDRQYARAVFATTERWPELLAFYRGMATGKPRH